MGKGGGKEMNETLDDVYFDYAFKILNYAMEFVKSPGYASLRMTDIIEKTIELSSRIEGVSRAEFYEKLREKFENRVIMSERKDLEIFLDELIMMFIEEWKKKATYEGVCSQS